MYYEKSNAGTTRENPIIVLEVVKPCEVDEFSNNDDSVEVIPALKQGRDNSDTDDSDDDESVDIQKSDGSDEVSENSDDTSDDTSEAGKKKVAFIDEMEKKQKTTTTRIGRVIKKPIRMDLGLNEATMNYFASLAELEQAEVLGISAVENQFMEYANVGAGVGGGFENTNELKPMKYEQAINGPDGEAWKIEIDNEHDRMVKNGVFEVVTRK